MNHDVRVFKKNEQGNLCYMLSHNEFKCRCNRENCTFTLASPKLLFAWERMRRRLKKQIAVSSGFRCQEHNKDVGGIMSSRHVTGMAIDIVPTMNVTFEELEKCAREEFDVVLAYKNRNYIHCHVNF